MSDNCTHQNLGSVQIEITSSGTTVSADCLDCGAQIRK
jgi:hypothetical protein